MTGRKCTVEVDGRMSSLTDILYGIPQGSILGPLLYILATMDIDLWITEPDLATYADDTSNTAKGKSETEVIEKLERNAQELMIYMTSNGLCMNPQKNRAFASASIQ